MPQINSGEIQSPALPFLAATPGPSLPLKAGTPTDGAENSSLAASHHVQSVWDGGPVTQPPGPESPSDTSAKAFHGAGAESSDAFSGIHHPSSVQASSVQAAGGGGAGKAEASEQHAVSAPAGKGQVEVHYRISTQEVGPDWHYGAGLTIIAIVIFGTISLLTRRKQRKEAAAREARLSHLNDEIKSGQRKRYDA